MTTQTGLPILHSYAEQLREEAKRLDRLADAAKAEGDTWDEADLRSKAMDARRRARQLEVK